MNYIKQHVDYHVAKTGESRTSVAERLGMPYSTFLSKVNGPSEFDVSEACKLAELLGCTVDQMVRQPI